MKVYTTGDRQLSDCTLFGVAFEKGVAELTPDEVRAGVFENLLNRYDGVVDKKPKAPAKKLASEQEFN